MGSNHTNRLEALLQSSQVATSPELKTEFGRLSLSLKERLRFSSGASLDVFHAALSVLGKVKGTAHAEVRMDCLVHCGHFFYTNGYAKEALKAA
jgi:hypothetical protein